MEKIVVYRSQSEANTDEFVQMIFTWIAVHPYKCILFIGLVIVGLILLNKYANRR